MAKQETQPKPALETESKQTIEKTVEKSAIPSKETITAARTEEAADTLSRKMAEFNARAAHRFSEKQPTFKEKAESLFKKMIEKVQDVKDRIKATTEMVKGRSQKGAETGIKTEGALADLQKTFEKKSPAEQQATLTKGIELVVAVQALQKNGETPQRVEGGKGETERVLLEEKIPMGMRIPVSGFVTLRRAEKIDNEKEEFFSDKDLEKFKGSMNAQGGVIAFVDHGGKAWVTGDTPENRKAFSDANYSQDGNMNVPLSHGEELSEHEKDQSLENYQAKWKRIQDISRAKREEGNRATERQNTEKKLAA